LLCVFVLCFFFFMGAGGVGFLFFSLHVGVWVCVLCVVCVCVLCCVCAVCVWCGVCCVYIESRHQGKHGIYTHLQNVAGFWCAEICTF